MLFYPAIFSIAFGQLCSFTDACARPKSMKAKVGGHITDSCKPRRTYQVLPGCGLRAVDARSVPRMQGVVFVEQGQVFRQSYMTDVRNHLFKIQSKWYNEFGGTFALANPPVIRINADHPLSYYTNTPDGIHGSIQRWFRLGNMKNEVFRKLGLKTVNRGDETTRLVVYPVAQSDGKVGQNYGGVWMDGDDLRCIGSGTNTFPFDRNGPASCLGHVSHELGHTFGLAHTGSNTDCMVQGFYRATIPSQRECSFGAENRAEVQRKNSNWLKEIPGAVIG